MKNQKSKTEWETFSRNLFFFWRENQQTLSILAELESGFVFRRLQPIANEFLVEVAKL